jgi:hypothetical protein
MNFLKTKKSKIYAFAAILSMATPYISLGGEVTKAGCDGSNRNPCSLSISGLPPVQGFGVAYIIQS